MTKLEPIQKTVCILCDQPWDAHVRIAIELARDAQMLDYDEESTDPTPKEVNKQLKPIICVQLLKVANRGPMGPPGVQGPMGMRA